MNELLQDLRYALRMLRGSPGFTTVAVATVALGIAAGTTIFAFVDALLLRPLSGLEEPDRMVVVEARSPMGHPTSLSYPDFLDLERTTSVFSDLAGFRSLWTYVAADGGTERVDGALVSGAYFRVLGVPIEAGRALEPRDDRAGGEPVVVVGSSYARQRFGSAAAAVGRTLRINAHPFTVVGVAAAGFRGTRLGDAPRLWVPIAHHRLLTPPFWADFPERRGARWLQVVARLEPGRTGAEAASELAHLSTLLEERYPESNEAYGMSLRPLVAGQLHVDEHRSIRRHSLLLGAAVGLVLLIACANVANLLIARATARQQELAIRLAIGASRSRLARQLLTESLVLALAGGLGGVLLATWLIPAAHALLPLALTFEVEMDLRLLAFALAVSLASAALFGSLPAWRASRPALVSELRRQQGRPGGLGPRQLLLVAQVAVSLLLLIGAGLFLRSLDNLIDGELGFDAEDVLVATIDPSVLGYRGERIRDFNERLMERIRSTPGVLAASFTTSVQTSGDDLIWDVLIESHEGEGERGPVGTPDPIARAINFSVVGSDYFAAMGTPLVAGRDFRAADRHGAPGVVIVNQAMVDSFWPGESGLGRRIDLDDGGEEGWLEVVGVARNGKYVDLRDESRPFIFLPQAQHYDGFFEGGERSLLVRAATEPLALAETLRRQVEALDPEIPLFNVTLLRDVVASSVALELAMSWLLGVFAAVAVILAASGLYGVSSYSVSRRLPEIGIRLALGADTRAIYGRFVGEALLLVAAGTLLGALGVVSLGRVVSSFLYGLSGTDPVTFVAAALLLALVAALAAARPAGRAARVDPTVALRSE